MDNSFSKLLKEGLNTISKAFASKKKSDEAVGIDIGSSSIKVVQLKKRNGKAVLETYGVLSLGPYAKQEVGTVTNLQAEELSQAILDVIKESNVTTNSGIIAIPSLSSLIFTITLPSNKFKEEELRGIIEIESRKYIPVPISEITLDWSIIPDEIDSLSENEVGETTTVSVDKKVEVLVIAIHNDTLIKFQDILKKTQLISDSFEMEIFSTIRSSFDHDLAPILLIDFGASKVKVSIIEAGIIRVFHVVNRGSADISRNISQALSISFDEAEKLKRSVGLDVNTDQKVATIIEASVNYILTDVNSIVLAYEKKYNKNISKVVLIGGGSLLKGFSKKAKENFHTEVISSNPFLKTEAPAFLEPVLEVSGPEFSVAVGLALRQLS
jgi:type IV pilus assembly protein PilM